MARLVLILVFGWVAGVTSLPRNLYHIHNSPTIATFVPNLYGRSNARNNKEFGHRNLAVADSAPSYDDDAKQYRNYEEPSLFSTSKPYNKKYPFTSPTTRYRIGVITDLDNNAIVKPERAGDPPKNWVATIREGNLEIQFNQNDPNLSTVHVEWDKERVYKLRSGYSYGSRGMELSTLNVFNGNVYTCDDKTGIVFELPIGDSLDLAPIPWAVLADGNATGSKGFKCEWATVKDEHLWIGGHGLASVSKAKNGSINNNQKFVKKISPTGEVTHLDWRANFDKMAEALGIKFPGYVTHESAGWSDLMEKWVFMPRRINKMEYSDEGDSMAGSNIVLTADEDFNSVAVTKVGDLVPTHGFASFKWVPGTGDQIVVALKTVENGDTTESYIMAFTLDGKVLLQETKFADEKYEGIEFL